jgi:hypothetical protein
MAILESRTQTGISWVKESVALFKTAPRKWLMLALAYIGFFMILPSIAVLQFLAFISILMWPVFLAVAIAQYRNADLKKQQTLGEIFQQIKPKMPLLIGLGAACLLYAAIISFVLNSDLQGLATLAQNKDTMTESQMMAFVQKMLPVMLKMLLLSVPLLMATWFSPMLIAFNNYSVLKAIKSSIAGSLQFMVALTAAWLLLTAGILGLMMGVGIIGGIISALLPALGQLLIPFILFGCMLLAIALMLAFQYVSYRDVFRAA